jgi:hypothetical protein
MAAPTGDAASMVWTEHRTSPVSSRNLRSEMRAVWSGRDPVNAVWQDLPTADVVSTVKPP